MPRFLHTADWQIGRRYTQFDPDDAAFLAEERLQAVARIAALATEQQVDAVLVAGDVFDLQTVPDRTLRRLFALLDGFAGPWVMIPGNHDAALAESVWTRAQRLGLLPPHLHLALQPGVVELPACRTAVLAAPLVQRHTSADTTAAFDGLATPEGWLRVGLAHGSVEGILPGEIDSPNPIAADRCTTARLDYLALGDWHGLKQVHPRCAYSGTPEPERFKDNDPGWCLLVDLQPGAPPQLTPLRSARHTWLARSAVLAVPSDVEALCESLAALGPDTVLQLQVAGHCDLPGQQRLHAALGRAEAQLRALRLDLAELRLLPTDADLAALHADGYVAELVDELRQQQADGQAGEPARLAREALAILCSALAADGQGAA